MGEMTIRWIIYKEKRDASSATCLLESRTLLGDQGFYFNKKTDTRFMGFG